MGTKYGSPARPSNIAIPAGVREEPEGNSQDVVVSEVIRTTGSQGVRRDKGRGCEFIHSLEAHLTRCGRSQSLKDIASHKDAWAARRMCQGPEGGAVRVGRLEGGLGMGTENSWGSCHTAQLPMPFWTERAKSGALEGLASGMSARFPIRQPWLLLTDHTGNRRYPGQGLLTTLEGLFLVRGECQPRVAGALLLTVEVLSSQVQLAVKATLREGRMGELGRQRGCPA